MVRKLLLSAAAAALFASPAAAATFVVTFNGSTTIPNNNNFKTDLNGLSLFSYATVGATINVVAAGPVKFEFLGSESGFVNRFTSGANFFDETDGNNFASPVLMFLQSLGLGPLNVSFNNQRAGAENVTAGVGADAFGIFLPIQATTAPGQYVTSTLVFGFDDKNTSPDDNHDDFILRITTVPEPETWAMMIGGFGLIGAAMRRRDRAAHTVCA